MISLEYIKSHTKGCIQGETEHSSHFGTFDILKQYKPLLEFDDMDISPEMQPVELIPFWLAHRKATKELGRKDLLPVNAFYEEWSKNPAPYENPRKPVIGDLRDILAKYMDFTKDTNIVIRNYDGLTMWTHGHEDFVDALKDLKNLKFDVVDIKESYNTILKKKILKIILQCDDYNAFRELAVTANRYCGDRIFGPQPG